MQTRSTAKNTAALRALRRPVVMPPTTGKASQSFRAWPLLPIVVEAPFFRTAQSTLLLDAAALFQRLGCTPIWFETPTLYTALHGETAHGRLIPATLKDAWRNALTLLRRVVDRHGLIAPPGTRSVKELEEIGPEALCDQPWQRFEIIKWMSLFSPGDQKAISKPLFTINSALVRARAGLDATLHKPYAIDSLTSSWRIFFTYYIMVETWRTMAGPATTTEYRFDAILGRHKYRLKLCEKPAVKLQRRMMTDTPASQEELVAQMASFNVNALDAFAICILEITGWSHQALRHDLIIAKSLGLVTSRMQHMIKADYSTICNVKLETLETADARILQDIEDAKKKQAQTFRRSNRMGDDSDDEEENDDTDTELPDDLPTELPEIPTSLAEVLEDLTHSFTTLAVAPPAGKKRR